MGTRSTKEDIRRVASLSSFVQSNSDESERRRYERQRDSDLASCFRAPSLRRRERAFNVPIGIAGDTSYELRDLLAIVDPLSLRIFYLSRIKRDEERDDSTRLVSSRRDALRRSEISRRRDVRVAIYLMSMSISISISKYLGT